MAHVIPDYMTAKYAGYTKTATEGNLLNPLSPAILLSILGGKQ
jgi:hypothetical protein